MIKEHKLRTKEAIHIIEKYGLHNKNGEESTVRKIIEDPFNDKDLLTHSYLLFDDENRIYVGMGLLTERYTNDDNRYFVGHIYVDPAYRGKGLGQNIVDNLKEFSNHENVDVYWFYRPESFSLYSKNKLNDIVLFEATNDNIDFTPEYEEVYELEVEIYKSNKKKKQSKRNF